MDDFLKSLGTLALGAGIFCVFWFFGVAWALVALLVLLICVFLSSFNVWG